jgi:hypothetical protein
MICQSESNLNSYLINSSVSASKRRGSARIREPGLDDGATEIAMISPFDLFFSSLRDYFGDVSEFHFFCRILYSARSSVCPKGRSSASDIGTAESHRLELLNFMGFKKPSSFIYRKLLRDLPTLVRPSI